MTIQISLPPTTPRTPEVKTQDDRKADLYFAFQHGVDAAHGDHAAREDFERNFAGDPEALEEFNRGLAEGGREPAKK